MFPRVVGGHLINCCTADGFQESLNCFYLHDWSCSQHADSVTLPAMLMLKWISRRVIVDDQACAVLFFYWNICCQVVLRRKLYQFSENLTQALGSICFASRFHLCQLDNLPVNWQLVALVAISLTSWTSPLFFLWMSFLFFACFLGLFY